VQLRSGNAAHQQSITSYQIYTAATAVKNFCTCSNVKLSLQNVKLLMLKKTTLSVPRACAVQAYNKFICLVNYKAKLSSIS
jgi:hypothetical protein